MAMADKTASTKGNVMSHGTGRRVVKAMAPPPSKSHNDGTQDKEEEGVKRHAEFPPQPPSHNSVPPVYDSAVLHEEEQALEERWRNERLDAGLSTQKRHRHDELESRRKQHTGTTKDESVTTAAPMSSSFAYSVEPQFPEHKRKVETASILPNRPLEEPLDKRHRVVDEAESQDPAKDRSIPLKNDKDDGKWSIWKDVIPTASFCVVALLVTQRLLFGRNR